MQDASQPNEDEMVVTPEGLREEYRRRFEENADYRNAIWSVLVSEFFQKWVPPKGSVLDLGAGWCEFINHVRASERYAMDLNPDVTDRVQPGIEVLLQDCSRHWNLDDNSLDTIFTSNFFEHLPDKAALQRTLLQVFRTLKPGGCLICLGPNIKYLPGAYWDFWDHYLALTELALQEVLELTGFTIESNWPRFLPYSMSQGSRPNPIFLQMYLKMPFVWPLFGRQFLIVARKP